MNKKIMIVITLCGPVGTVDLSAGFTPGMYYTSGRMARTVISKGLVNSFSKVKISKSIVEKATRGLGKESLVALTAAKTAKAASSVIPSVPTLGTLSKNFPSPAQVYTTLTAQKESFMRVMGATFAPALQATPKGAFVTSGVAAPSLVQTGSRVAKDVASTSLKYDPVKLVAAGYASVAAGFGSIIALLDRNVRGVISPVQTLTAFQSALTSLSQHKMLAGSSAAATVATAYCVRYKINPVTKVKSYFGTKVSK